MMVHNSHMPYYRSPQGAVPCETMVRLRFVSDEAQGVTLRIWNGAETLIPMRFDGVATYEAEYLMPKTPCLVWYEFIVKHTHCDLCYGNAWDLMGGEGSLQGFQRHSYQITVYDKDYTVPEYMHKANIYQIFPDRFFKAPTRGKLKRADRYMHQKWDETPILIGDSVTGENIAADFYGGTLTGIAEKLGYLKELGINLIYLNPIFESASNHRYNTADYTQIDPLLGTNDEFKALCEKAEAMGIRIMLDGVFSHTGSDSIYFNKDGNYPSIGAYQSPDSPYYSWYQFMRYPDIYKSWWGFQTLPEVNKADEGYIDFMLGGQRGIVPLWVKRGACGWRLDVADELPMDFLRQMRRSIKKANPHAVLLGEVWEDASNKVAYGEGRCYCLGDTLDSVMNYPLRDGICSFLRGETTAHQLARLIRHQQEVYPAPFLYGLMNLIGSHDRARAINVLIGKTYVNIPLEERGEQVLSPEEYALGKARLLKAYDILCALPGAPTVYYGDEAGMQGGPDPFCRGTFPWGREDGEIEAHVKALLNARLQSRLLQTGKLKVYAPDDDTIQITRFTDTHDAFMTPAKQGEKTFRISRRV